MGLGIAAPRYIAIARAGVQEGYSAGHFALATNVKAVNSRNLIVSLAIFVVLCLIRRDSIWMSLSLVALAALSIRATSVRLRGPSHPSAVTIPA